MVFSSVTHVQSHRGLELLPRRILMTADPIGGVWSYSLELAHGLAEYGIEVVLATMGAPLSEQQRREVAEERNVVLYESSFKLEWMEDSSEDMVTSGDWLLSLDSQLRPDLVHLNGYGHASLPWQCPCLVVAHSCVLSWWEAVRRKELPQGLEPYRSCVAKGLAAADLVVAPTAAMLQSIEKLYLPLQKSRVIYNARSRTRFAPGRKKNFILSVGRIWDDAKNIAALARNAYKLHWPVYVAGEQKHPQGTPGKNVTGFDGLNHLGFLDSDTLAPWYAAASIYALPAKYEPFGLTILEAAQSGCALVLGDIPSLRELWDEAAVFVNPDDDDALVRELRNLCNDTDRVEALGERALVRSRSFNSSKMTSAYLAAYRELDADDEDDGGCEAAGDGEIGD